MPQLAQLPVPLVVNVMGFSRDEVAELVQAFARRDEVARFSSTSRPNVETWLDGADPDEVARLLQTVRPLTEKPLIVKLTPNATDVAAVAVAAQDAGASAVSLINTIRGMALAPRTAKPWLGGVTGGVSGPAVRAIALAQVHAVRAAVQIPIVAMGGSSRARMRSTCSTRGRPRRGRHRELPRPGGWAANRGRAGRAERAQRRGWANVTSYVGSGPSELCTELDRHKDPRNAHLLPEVVSTMLKLKLSYSRISGPLVPLIGSPQDV